MYHHLIASNGLDHLLIEALAEIQSLKERKMMFEEFDM
jgi:hypothetical protein